MKFKLKIRDKNIDRLVEVKVIPKTKKKETKKKVLDVSEFDPKTSKKLLKIL